MSIGHFVVMRFGIGVYDEKWLDYRLRLLRATMVPSLLAQGTRFTFVALTDREHSTKYRDAIEEIAGRFHDGVVLPIEFHCHRREAHGKHIAAVCEERGYTHFISTRVDDDDALTSGAMQAVQRRAEEAVAMGKSAAIIISDGLRYLPAEGIGVWQRGRSPGIGLSVVSESKHPSTNILAFNHRKVAEEFSSKGLPVFMIGRGEAAWLYTLHKYCDADFAERAQRIREAKNCVSPTETDLASFGLDLSAFREWLELEAVAEPLSGRTTGIVERLEREVEALRSSGRVDEVEPLLKERRRLGSSIVKKPLS